ncbi:hypothetical protein [Actinomycetospora termitidis]|uniref:HNH endonuclease n=1 Tax=Actinomycetospora termitidis TaxID=3053470 RepID=A0ABT7MFM4_9PSEU|nr:hypothetical protein [Actinomycetospora sp. Odt1-22]MDL5159455.1 hypothetical protein [Actinomycetospora sp. Odt1-22]
MKRSGPPKRTKPLTAHTDLARESGLARSVPLPRASPPSERRPTPQRAAQRLQLATWAQVKQLAHVRDGWACLGCGRNGVPLDAHHRVFKGAGGSKLLDVVQNAISLCGPGNAAGCHGRAHTEKNGKAREYGWSLPHGADPLTVPVRYRDGWYHLDEHGDRYRTTMPHRP